MVYKQGGVFILIHLLALGQCAIAIAIIVVVRQNLWWLISRRSGWYEECLMAKPEVGTNLCSYTYWVTGLSFFLSVALMFAQCFIRERRSYILATVGITLLGTIWWLAFAITTTAYGVDANKANIIQESYRNAAWILGWVNTGLFAAALTLGSLVAFGKLGGGLSSHQSTSMGYTSGPVGYQPGPYTQPSYQQQPYVATGYPTHYPPAPPPGYPPQGYGQPYNGVPGQQQQAQLATVL